MFGWLRKKKPTNALDALIVTLYGDPPPPKRADVNSAIQLAHQELLGGAISNREVSDVAAALSSGPIPYSTHDLALSVALHFFKQEDRIEHLQGAQMNARLLALEWAKDKKVVPMLLGSFEDTLYRLYRP